MPPAGVAYIDFLRRLGAPALSLICPNMPAKVQATADRGLHTFADVYKKPLWEEANDMCLRWHGTVLPLSVVKQIRGASISPSVHLCYGHYMTDFTDRLLSCHQMCYEFMKFVW